MTAPADTAPTQDHTAVSGSDQRLVLGSVVLIAVDAPRACNACTRCYFFQGKPGSERDCIALRKIYPELDCFGDSRPDERDVIFIPENAQPQATRTSEENE